MYHKEEYLRRIDVLDKGFVELVDYMGIDRHISREARQSYNKRESDYTEKQDNRLVGRLYEDQHTSPFEMVEFKFHCVMPISTARQWVRHRTANVNESSTRYTEVAEDKFYIPELSRLLKQHNSNKQMSGEDLIENPELAQMLLTKHAQMCYNQYRQLLDMGLAREVARDVLPLSTYTEWTWKIDLHNLLKFLGLRTAPDAQWEIRQYALAIKELITPIVPVTMTAWQEQQDLWAEFKEWRKQNGEVRS